MGRHKPQARITVIRFMTIEGKSRHEIAKTLGISPSNLSSIIQRFIPELRIRPRSRTLEERLWPRVRKGGPDECWLWTGAVSGDGYGSIGRNRKVDRPHRISWELANGKPIPKGMVIMHACDTPTCCNPAHLSLGTHKENQADCIAKGRQGTRTKRVSVELAREIAAAVASGETKLAVSRRFGVTQTTVRAIVRGERTKDIHGTSYLEPPRCSVGECRRQLKGGTLCKRHGEVPARDRTTDTSFKANEDNSEARKS